MDFFLSLLARGLTVAWPLVALGTLTLYCAYSTVRFFWEFYVDLMWIAASKSWSFLKHAFFIGCLAGLWAVYLERTSLDLTSELISKSAVERNCKIDALLGCYEPNLYPHLEVSAVLYGNLTRRFIDFEGHNVTACLENGQYEYVISKYYNLALGPFFGKRNPSLYKVCDGVSCLHRDAYSSICSRNRNSRYNLSEFGYIDVPFFIFYGLKNVGWRDWFHILLNRLVEHFVFHLEFTMIVVVEGCFPFLEIR